MIIHKYECCTRTQYNSEVLEYKHQSTIYYTVSTTSSKLVKDAKQPNKV